MKLRSITNFVMISHTRLWPFVTFDFYSEVLKLCLQASQMIWRFAPCLKAQRDAYTRNKCTSGKYYSKQKLNNSNRQVQNDRLDKVLSSTHKYLQKTPSNAILILLIILKLSLPFTGLIFIYLHCNIALKSIFNTRPPEICLGTKQCFSL